MRIKTQPVLIVIAAFASASGVPGQLVDQTRAPNAAHEGISKSYTDEAGAGRGDVMTPDSSAFIIGRDPFRAIRRGRQLFQRKFTKAEGLGPIMGDGAGDINTLLPIGAGLADSCAACHSRPRGSAGVGGNVATRPDSRTTPHLFGLGIREMLADEITTGLRARRTAAIAQAKSSGQAVVARLTAKGIDYGTLTANADGTVDTTGVQGVDPDLRVRPFFADGEEYSIRAFVTTALQNEMGMQAVDPDLMQASRGRRVVTPSGMVLDGGLDTNTLPPTDDPTADLDGDGVKNEAPQSIVDYLEFYLLNYFKPATYEQTHATRHGKALMAQIGCNSCHIADLQIDQDRRVADVETVYDPVNGALNNLFATAMPLINTVTDGSGRPAMKVPAMQPFLVRNIYTDMKRHDLGPNFYERNYDGAMTTLFMTRALWGVGTNSTYGHDGRSINLATVILRHGGEAQQSRDAFVALSQGDRRDVLDFLGSLVLFAPDDTASNLAPAAPSTPGYPQFGHGSIKLTVLFNDPTNIE